MGRKYQILDQDSLYFVTFTVFNWIDVFIRGAYREIFIESVKYCQKEKGLEVFAWVIMTSHIHMITGRRDSNDLQNIIRDMKSFTSRNIRKYIGNESGESRKEWMLWMFSQAGTKNPRNKDFQFWQQHNHPIELTTNEMMDQRLDYIHMNPVEAGFVSEPYHWRWSSAADYYGEGKGLIDIKFIE